MYIFRRLLFSMPVLLLISMATFFLNQCAPVDAVRKLRPEFAATENNEEKRLENYQKDAKYLGLDIPVFYFTITTAAYPDTFYRVKMPDRRDWLDALTAQTGNWPAVQNYAAALSKLTNEVESLPDSIDKIPFRLYLNSLRKTHWLNDLGANLDSIATPVFLLKNENPSVFQPTLFAFENLKTAAENLQKNKTPCRLWQPAFYLHGFENQYHRWFTGFFTGNLGKSFSNGEPVSQEIGHRLGRTIFINLTAIFLAYLIGLPLGLMAARHAGRRDRWIRNVLMALYSMPVFWLGGLLIIFFATDGLGFNIFSFGINMENTSGGTFEWISKNIGSLILPILTLTLHALAVFALQMRGAALEVLPQNFVRTARAKGLSEQKVFGKHIFRNALFPMITIFGGVFPAVFAGSLVIEYVFAVPGMGTKIYEAFDARDYPVLMAITMIAAALTILGQLVADILYAVADPRVRFEK